MLDKGLRERPDYLLAYTQLKIYTNAEKHKANLSHGVSRWKHDL